MNLTEEQEKIQEGVMKLLSPYCKEGICYTPYYFLLKNENGDPIGETVCDKSKCIKSESKNIRNDIGKGKHLFKVWFHNDHGDHDRIERCAICFIPLNSSVTWIESEFEYFEKERKLETKQDIINNATDIFAIYYSLGWCVDEDETLPDRVMRLGEKIIEILK